MTQSSHRLLALMCCVLALAAGCGEDSSDGGVSGAPVVDTAGDDDTSIGDDSAVADDGGQAQADAGGAGDSDAANGAVSDIKTADCPGGPGCACAENDECDTSICLPLAVGGECADKCVDKCPKGYQCASVSAGGGDTVTVCVPALEWLCDPCVDSNKCGGLGLNDAACVQYGSAGAFCGIACSDDAGCPADYACKAATSVEGKPVKQCVRKDEKGAAFGQCACSEAAKTKQLETACFIEHKNDKGELVGKCAGDRVCKPSGLSSCQAANLGAEACNGLDDDCDGKTDEGTCDDSNTCTLDACDQAAAGGKPACVHKKLDAQPCDADGSACTEKDACDQGLCVPGKPIDCNDGNGCTVDACDPQKGCTQTNNNAKACEADGNPCTDGDQCDGGKCKVGLVKACASGDVCVIGKCSPATGQCAFKNIEVPCDDGSACTTKDACDSGFCTGKPIPCDDKNGCTADTCNKTKGCQHKAIVAACDDNSPCTWSDTCKGGACAGLPLTATDCDDNNACTTEGCDPKKVGGTGKLAACTHKATSGGVCDDGNACTKNDTCVQGACKGGSFCCACKHDSDCNQKAKGCLGTAKCVAFGACTTCKIDTSTAVKCADDGNECTTVACDHKTGKCATKLRASGLACDADGSVCTQNDACKVGSCAKGVALPCDDNSPCTADACDPQKGCNYSDQAATCEDGDICTSGDKCAKGKDAKWGCQPGAAVDCNDNNPCTVESCVKAKGCDKVVVTTKTEVCYSGPNGTDGKGTCTSGKRTCQKDGTFSKCIGEIVPLAVEVCDGKDDNCDGKTDVGCSAAGFQFVVTSVAVDEPGTKLREVPVAGSASGDKTVVELGWLAWLQRWIK